MAFNDKVILITGGTGSFGQEFIRSTLAKYRPRKLIVFSRDEMKQWEMARAFSNEKRIRFFLGDVRDRERLYRALDNVDMVVHAAATKIVPTAEYNPFECVKTNVFGAMNLIDACIDKKVSKVVALSTDKASSPINLYGATKLTSDKLFVAANAYSGDHGTAFSVVRYGNVMGSRGSVLPLFKSLVDNGAEYLPITDPQMTRFMITLAEGVELVWKAFSDMIGGEIYVKKIPSINIMDIARAISEKTNTKILGMRAGEKLHEQMIGLEDAAFTYEFQNHFKILSPIKDWSASPDVIKNGRRVSGNFVYSSDNNSDWMSIDELRNWIKVNL